MVPPGVPERICDREPACEVYRSSQNGIGRSLPSMRSGPRTLSFTKAPAPATLGLLRISALLIGVWVSQLAVVRRRKASRRATDWGPLDLQLTLNRMESSRLGGLGPDGSDQLDARRSNSVVYHWCMGRTNIDVDEDACQLVMHRYHLSTKREAVNFALRLLAGEAMSTDDARALRGSGWEGDLEELRSGRSS